MTRMEYKFHVSRGRRRVYSTGWVDQDVDVDEGDVMAIVGFVKGYLDLYEVPSEGVEMVIRHEARVVTCDACAFFLQPLEEGGAGACDRLDDQVTRARRPKDTACDHFTRTRRCGTCRHFCQPSPGQSVGACAHDQHDEPIPAQSKDVACEFHQLGGK